MARRAPVLAVLAAAALSHPAFGPGPGRAGSASAQEYPTASAWFSEVARSVLSLETYQASFRQTPRWVAVDTESEAWLGTIYLKRPAFFRIEYTKPEGHLQVCDGTTVFTYVPESGEVLASRLAEDAGGADLLRWILEKGEAIGMLEEEAFEGRRAWKIRISPPPGTGLASMLLWTVPEKPEILQYEMTDSSGNRNVYRLTEVRRNPPLSADLFRFTPPPGVPVIELGTP